jgi:hypothetical protein
VSRNWTLFCILYVQEKHRVVEDWPILDLAA